MKTKKNQKQVSIEEYIENYCQEKRIRERFAVYVSPQTHRNLKNIVRLFGREYHTTTSSLADTIISRHVEAYRELLNDAHQENVCEFLGWLKDTKQCESGTPDEQIDAVGI
jgi:hypothetical protein